MEAAGTAVARAVRGRWPRGPVAVYCGPGGNGGDGYVCARHLAASGWPVWVETDPAAPPPSGDAAVMARRWTGPVRVIGSRPLGRERIVDALYGAGLKRPLGPVVGERLARLAPDRVLAVDVPSGWHGDSAQAVGDQVGRAAATVTFETRKPAHVLDPAASACGAVIVAPIGIPAAAFSEGPARAFLNHPDLWRAQLPWPDATSHKHRRGRVGVYAGLPGPSLTLGAPRLSARAAQRIGAGWVVLWAEGAGALASEPAALMVQSPGDDKALAAKAGEVEAVVVGPGLGRGPAAMAVVETFARFAKGLVVDADGLSAFAEDPHALLRHGREGLVLTPHAGEFARLFPDLAAEGGDLIARTRAAASRAGCVVVHKGATTVIAAPDGTAVVNRHASPFLATAGTGDVLAGVIAGLLAQGMTPFWAAAAGVWLHGDAGLAIGPGLIADDVVEAVAGSLRRLGAG